jgi:hypothetical protein
MLARHFRVLFSFDESGKPTIARGNPISSPSLMPPNAKVIRSGDPEMRDWELDKCLYCNATELLPRTGKPLTEEHVIPKGLGGPYVIKHASCDACQKHINENIEQPILAGGMLAPRRHLKIRGRNRKHRASDYPYVAVVDGKSVTFRLPLHLHPSILFLPFFHPPFVLNGWGGLANVFAHTFNSPDEAIKTGGRNIASHGFDTVLFSQMLAKIAHGYAIMILGNPNFKSLIVDLIKKVFEPAEQYAECYRYVGGNPNIFGAAPQDELHHIGHELIQYGDKTLIVVHIRFFANLGGPAYLVVAGEALGQSSK